VNTPFLGFTSGSYDCAMDAEAESAPEGQSLRPVTGVDAAFVHLETPSTHLHVIGVAILDPTDAPDGFDAEVLRRVLAERIADVDVLTRRVVDAGVGGVSQPHWMPTEVDLDAHVYPVSLPQGSGPAELAALVGEIGSSPLRRDRPMWEFAVVDGLADGRSALVAKIHHSLVDGVAAVGVLGAIFDLEPTPPPPGPIRKSVPAPDPPRREFMAVAARTITDQPGHVARAVTRLTSTSWRIVQKVVQRDSNATLPLTAPRTRLSSSITPRRATSFATIDIDAVKEVRRAFGVTFNDVVVAIAAGVVRDWLLPVGDLPDRPLVAAIPTSVRTDDANAASGNAVSSLFGALPTHLDDPAARVRFVAEEMPAAKAFHEQLGPQTLNSLASVAPWNLAATLFRAYSNLGLADRLPPAVNLVLTSVPGPSVPLYCAGAKLVDLFPMGPIFDGAALNITAMSYTDRVCFGFLVCPDVVPPVQQLADAVPRVLDEMLAAAHAEDLAPSTSDASGFDPQGEAQEKRSRAMDLQERNRAALAAVSERRDEFYEGILELERAMAAPAGDHAGTWAAASARAVEDMQHVLDDHIRETEAPGSFYDDVIEHSPHLVNAAHRLQAEHPPLAARVEALALELKTVTDDDGVEATRQDALELIKALLQHRHRGAELVYDAYNVDVAPGD
jgi:WS/DGAT/MGAT family acyltransferase